MTALFKSSVYNKKDRLGKQPRMYRVSTRFLGCVGNPDAHIRKLKIKSKAVSSLGLTNFFLMPDQRTYQIINRRDRAAFLTNHCHISPDLFPKYFVQDQKAVVSLNHEIVCKENQVYVVWYPQSDFGGDFLSFIKKWGGVFKAGAKIQCLAITTNRPTQTLLAQFETERENPKETSKVATYHEEKARSRGIQPQKSNKKKIPCQLTTVHYPDVWQMYTEFGGRRT
ncbi:MAG: hypothetical protein QNK37_38300 [Acidobacteriota bacterium]|nr:hypothetical protein [Acidobacteriota bacterium]